MIKTGEKPSRNREILTSNPLPPFLPQLFLADPILTQESLSSPQEAFRYQASASLTELFASTPWKIIDVRQKFDAVVDPENVAVDFLIKLVDPSHPVDLPTMKVWNHGKSKRPSYPLNTSVEPYVCGIKIVADEASGQDQRDLCRAGLLWLKTWEPVNAHNTVIPLDSRLLDEWTRVGAFADDSPPIASDTAETTVANKPNFDIWNQSTEPAVTSISFWQPDEKKSSHIGSAQATVCVEQGGLKRLIVNDLGWIFGQWKFDMDVPSAQNGALREFLLRRMFPLIKTMFRTDLLKFSLNSAVLKNTIENMGNPGRYTSYAHEVDDFILVELFNRLGPDDLVSWMENIEVMEDYVEHLKQNGQLNALLGHLAARTFSAYAKPIEIVAHFATHWHWDHMIGASVMSEAILQVCSRFYTVLATTGYLQSANWLARETLYHREYDQPLVGNEYLVNQLPYAALNNGETVEVSDSMFITACEGDHSSPVIGGIINAGDKTIGIGADAKTSRAYRAFAEHAEAYGPFDAVVVEGTNTDDSNKPNLYANEGDVKENWRELLNKYPDDFIIVDIAKNHFQRLFNFIEEVMLMQGESVLPEHRRQLVISPKIIHGLLRLAQEYRDELNQIEPYQPFSEVDENNSPTETMLQKLLWFLSLLYAGEVKIWKKKGTKYDRYDQAIFDLYGYCSEGKIAVSPTDYVLLRWMNESTFHISGVQVGPARYFQSSYKARGSSAFRARAVSQFMIDHNFQSSDEDDQQLHTSGHGANVPYTHPEAKGGLLEGLDALAAISPQVTTKDGRRNLEVIFTHTTKRSDVVRKARTYPALSQTKFTETMKHPWHTVVLKAS